MIHEVGQRLRLRFSKREKLVRQQKQREKNISWGITDHGRNKDKIE